MKYLKKSSTLFIGLISIAITTTAAYAYSCPNSKDIVFQNGVWIITGEEQKFFKITQAPKNGDATVAFSQASAVTPFAAEDVAARINCKYQTKPGLIVTEARPNNFPAQCFILNSNWYYGDTNSNCTSLDPLQCQFTLGFDGRCHS